MIWSEPCFSEICDIVSSPSRPRRVEIMRSAGEVFAAEGYEGASMSQIAAAANVSKGTLYNYFPSKAELFTAFVSAGCEQITAKAVYEPALSDLRSELMRMARFMQTVLFSTDAIVLFRLVVMEAEKFPNLAKAFMDSGPNIIVLQMAVWLQHQSAAGLLQVDDPIFAAEQFLALIQAGFVHGTHIMLNDIKAETEVSRAVEGAVTIFLAAYTFSKSTLGEVESISNDKPSEYPECSSGAT